MQGAGRLRNISHMMTQQTASCDSTTSIEAFKLAQSLACESTPHICKISSIRWNASRCDQVASCCTTASSAIRLPAGARHQNEDPARRHCDTASPARQVCHCLPRPSRDNFPQRPAEAHRECALPQQHARLQHLPQRAHLLQGAQLRDGVPNCRNAAAIAAAAAAAVRNALRC